MTLNNSPFHRPVLVAEVTAALHGCGHILDCTLGAGGHAESLLNAGARVVGIDQDPEAVEHASDRLKAHAKSGRLTIHQTNFADLDEIEQLADAHFDGILLDLGVSSRQVDSEDRGFSFREGAPLDMRMAAGGSRSPAQNTAATILNESTAEEIAAILRENADEPRARRLASEIVRRRGSAPFETSDDLVRAIRAVLGPRSGPPDFARIFQGIRIAVNDELHLLADSLPRLRDRLKPSGRMVVISYHSGEDRIVKHTLRNWSLDCVCPPRQPICTCGKVPLGNVISRRAQKATNVEIAANPRARSARMRAWQKND